MFAPLVAPALRGAGILLPCAAKVQTSPDPYGPGYDPVKFRAPVKATAGSWAGIDADALIEDLYRAREEGSRPADRPYISYVPEASSFSDR